MEDIYNCSERLIRKTICSLTGEFSALDVHLKIQKRFRIDNRPLVDQVLKELCDNGIVKHDHLNIYTVVKSDVETDHDKGAKYARDSILASIIGMQNEIGNPEDQEYKTIQKVFEHIEQHFGEMFKPFKVQ